MKIAESPIVTFVRGITLLVLLVSLPGIAVFWNLLPKESEPSREQKPTPPKTERTDFFRDDSPLSPSSVSASAPESFYPPIPGVEAVPIVPASVSPAIQQVTWEKTQRENPIQAPQGQAPQGQAPLGQVAPDFASLEGHLKALGAKYYRLEKWGNRGELFRFSCWVAPSGQHVYAKHFEGIGTDAVLVMHTVIADIEKWKHVSR